jgi:uncharacterized protein (UPF0261 family)
VLGTLDTKGREVEFLAGALRQHGCVPSIMDLGILNRPIIRADVPREEVAGVGGAALADLVAGGDRERAMAVMADGSGLILGRLLSSGRLTAAVALGGSKGTWMSTTAMRALPWGIPKLMVAATVAGDLRRYTGQRDIVFMPTVVDIAGLNPMTRLVLVRAAAMIAAMASTGGLPDRREGAVAISMCGVVTPLGQRVQQLIERLGFETVVYPANGAGGGAMEEAARDGAFAAVVDLAALEESNEILGGICSAGPDRFGGDASMPRVVVPGAADMANFAWPDGVPARFRRRRRLAHTPAISLVRLSARESALVGASLGGKLARSRGPVEVLFPGKGLSAYDAPGQPFYDPAADRALLAALRGALGLAVRFAEEPFHINDAPFADAVLAAFQRAMRRGEEAASPAHAARAVTAAAEEGKA